MTFYIVLAVIVVGMGVAIPLARHWERQQRHGRKGNPHTTDDGRRGGMR